jgi:hypothetical protein
MRNMLGLIWAICAVVLICCGPNPRPPNPPEPGGEGGWTGFGGSSGEGGLVDPPLPPAAGAGGGAPCLQASCGCVGKYPNIGRLRLLCKHLGELGCPEASDLNECYCQFDVIMTKPMYEIDLSCLEVATDKTQIAACESILCGAI